MNPYLLTHPDPYDVWMTSSAISVRKHFYKGALWAKFAAALIAGADWFAPSLYRTNIPTRSYPITVAQNILKQKALAHPQQALEALIEVATEDESFGLSWGLGFPWMSKNGFYDDKTPFITHAPYAIEALIKLTRIPEVEAEAAGYLKKSFKLLDALKIQFQSGEELALSYAPIEEPRIVTNANSYACLLLAQQAAYTSGSPAENAQNKAAAVARFVVNQQLESGGWFYYADNEAGNFIDCFHSCFIIKNLIKASKLDNEIALISQSAIERGKAYLDENFLDSSNMLVRRFVERDFLDPYRWDLYDQAEYLGLLIDFNELEKAQRFHDNVLHRFTIDGDWYCKIDVFGRRWGKDFLRWGIMPFQYQSARLAAAV